MGEARRLALDHAEDVVLAHDQVLLAVDLDLGPGVLGEEDAVAGLDVEGPDLAVLLDLAVAHGDHLALDRLLLGRVGDDDAALGLLLLLHALHDEAVLQRTDLGGHLVDSLPFVPEVPGQSAGSLVSRSDAWHSNTSTAKGARIVTTAPGVSSADGERPSSRHQGAFARAVG